MSESIRIWSVEGDALSEIARQPVDLESRLEDWMDSDIGVLSDDLLVIGRQLDTEGGGILDLLCLDRAGDVVVVELKRGKTPREVVAQALDYAAWASGLSYDDLVHLGDLHLATEGGMEAAYRDRFESDLPDVLNAAHRLLIVASEIDARSERIIRYLSEVHGVSINAVTFNYFLSSDGRELLARTHLIEPDAVEDRTVRRSGSKRRRSLTLEDHRDAAARHGVAELFDRLVEGMATWFRPAPLKTMVSLGHRGTWMSVFNIVPSESEAGGLRFNAYKHRLARDFGVSADHIRALLPADTEPWVYSADSGAPENDWEGYTGLFHDLDEVERWVDGLASAPRHP